jgi:acetolactate decarboxylase
MQSVMTVVTNQRRLGDRMFRASLVRRPICSLGYAGSMNPEPLVRWSGAQRDVLRGAIDGRVALADLRTLPHLYALGPLEGVRGEVTVIDGAPAIARVVDGRVTVESSFDVRACFLVYASVARWHEEHVARPLHDLSELDRYVRDMATSRGLGADLPVPFLLRGTATSTTCHVLDKRDGLPHTPERHEAAKFRFTLESLPVEAIGFYSPSHRGVFTPQDSDLHVHLKTADGRSSGHVERLRLASGWRLAVPLS